MVAATMACPQPTARAGARLAPTILQKQAMLSGMSKSAAVLPRTCQQRPTAPHMAMQVPPTAAQVESHKEWMTFLQRHSLLHLADPLVRSGFDDLETLAEIEDADMEDAGIGARDAVRLRWSLVELRGRDAPADERNPVVVFLKEGGLQQYAETLIRNGFDDMEALLEIQDADMRDLGIARGHALKLAKRIRVLRESKVALAPALPQHPGRAAAAPPSRVPPPLDGGFKQGPQPTEAQSCAVQRSWERVRHLGSDALGEKLYRHTFRLAPQTMELFPPEVRCKYRDWSADEGDADERNLLTSPALRKLFAKVINAVGVSVAGLRQPGQMVPMLTQLGARHINYRVEEGYWKVLGEALIITLEECLGDEFTSEVRLAWSMVYGFMSAVMIEGLRGAIASQNAASAAWRSADDRSSLQSETSVGRRSASEGTWDAPALGKVGGSEDAPRRTEDVSEGATTN